MAEPESKPKRLYLKSYLQVIRNSVGSNMFRNFYIETLENGEVDALEDGVKSCAFFVSSVLALFKRISGVHATVSSVVNDLKNSGWYEVNQPEAGDVIVWEAKHFNGDLNEHIGFSIGNNQAISNSSVNKMPIIHSQTFDDRRKITHIFRTGWSDNV